jgi:hypothetical protein
VSSHFLPLLLVVIFPLLSSSFQSATKTTTSRAHSYSFLLLSILFYIPLSATRSHRPILSPPADLTSIPIPHFNSNSNSNSNQTSIGTPGNVTCNYDVGSPNLFRGEVTYSSYGYNVSWASAIAFLVLFSLSAGESLGLWYFSSSVITTGRSTG